MPGASEWGRPSACGGLPGRLRTRVVWPESRPGPAVDGPGCGKPGAGDQHSGADDLHACGSWWSLSEVAPFGRRWLRLDHQTRASECRALVSGAGPRPAAASQAACGRASSGLSVLGKRTGTSNLCKVDLRMGFDILISSRVELFGLYEAIFSNIKDKRDKCDYSVRAGFGRAGSGSGNHRKHHRLLVGSGKPAYRRGQGGGVRLLALDRS